MITTAIINAVLAIGGFFMSQGNVTRSIEMNAITAIPAAVNLMEVLFHGKGQGTSKKQAVTAFLASLLGIGGSAVMQNNPRYADAISKAIDTTVAVLYPHTDEPPTPGPTPTPAPAPVPGPTPVAGNVTDRRFTTYVELKDAGVLSDAFPSVIYYNDESKYGVWNMQFPVPPHTTFIS